MTHTSTGPTKHNSHSAGSWASPNSGTPHSALTARYSRQTVLPQIGQAGQEKLRAATVAIVGVGALGSSMAEMLARAGVGTLRLADRDYLELHNLQRQSLYTEADIESGLPKAVAASRHLGEINSEVQVEPWVADITPENVLGLVEGAAVVLDGTDNLQTRYLLNDACLSKGIPWVYSGVVGVCGVSLTVEPGESACLQCLYPGAPPPGSTDTCDVAGILGPVAHVMSAIAAAEAIKLIVGGAPAKGLLAADLWTGSFDRIEVPRNPDCPACEMRDFIYLEGEGWGRDATRLCGRDAVQIQLPGGKPNLADLGKRLSEGKAGEVLSNDYIVRLRTERNEMTIFADGRAIVKGTDDASVARSLVARYIGT
ncbi:MAG TPA: ThiF family adenylyltransferase [Chloroflexia bacterium]|nr:ThiF family adenylyltransferase [Chloroflexia bacterium]